MGDQRILYTIQTHQPPTSHPGKHANTGHPTTSYHGHYKGMHSILQLIALLATYWPHSPDIAYAELHLKLQLPRAHAARWLRVVVHTVLTSVIVSHWTSAVVRQAGGPTARPTCSRFICGCFERVMGKSMNGVRRWE